MPASAHLAVFTGSAAGSSTSYASAAAVLARSCARRGTGVVYGGGRVGLMGTVADAALEAGGDVIGVMPRSLVDREIAHPGVARLEVVEDMHSRKLRMAELADAFVALPGGAGTLDELFEAWTWQQLGLHSKPVSLYNVDGYWDPLVRMVDQMVERGFLAPEYREALVIESTPDGLFAALQEWRPPAPKWR